ncbi:MAG TPA: hypothetical protein VH592_12785 [Gemmataceae bacterium]|jgi:hypothetical protein
MTSDSVLAGDIPSEGVLGAFHDEQRDEYVFVSVLPSLLYPGFFHAVVSEVGFQSWSYTKRPVSAVVLRFMIQVLYENGRDKKILDWSRIKWEANKSRREAMGFHNLDETNIYPRLTAADCLPDLGEQTKS